MKRCQQSHEQCSSEEEDDDELGMGDHNYRHPCDDPASRWQNIIKAINSKCHNLRNIMKSQTE